MDDTRAGRLAGRRILVVGASSGIGRAVGLAAARAGARVAFAARRLPELERAAGEAGDAALAVRCDVADRASCDEAVAATVRAFGGLDTLLFATGMSPLAMLEEASGEEWRRVLETNLVGASQVTAACLAELRRNHGRALYLSSYAVRQPLPGLGLYRVSKVALDALIECWRMEHPDVDFTRVLVGNTASTGFADAWDPERLRATLAVWVERNLFPSPTMMSLDDLADSLVGILASPCYIDDVAIMPRARDASARSPD
jgi:NAD(P)-dependent dehydrogenase (short-subunit alcohol dehydrogenase family)